MDRNQSQDGKKVSPDDMQPDPNGEAARRELDEFPPPGTDPLHEGP
ncbi:MAG: hypothetical protein H0W74_04220 [Sphingosinicella sp.]|nr:hypothetical protein [Sphingosinicella sp.]